MRGVHREFLELPELDIERLDFAQIGPDDSVGVDIDPFDADEYDPAF